MTEIMTKSKPLTVIVPKGSFSQGSRNGLAGLFREAGYDKVANGDFGDDDSAVDVQQGDFRFLAVKGAGALEYQMWDNSQPMPIFMGSDVLHDAYWRVTQNNTDDSYSSPKTLLDLGIGKCNMQFLSPPDNPITEADNLSGRLVFTKYPALLKKTLDTFGVQVGRIRIWELNGADTRLKEQIERGNTDVAAFEIVESGRTAIRNGLQISPLVVPEEALPGKVVQKSYLGYQEMPAREVSTNMYLANPDAITDTTREQILQLGLSLEMASRPNTVAMITFNAPESILERFAEYGMQGPTCSPIIKREDQEPWFSLEVAVGKQEADAVVARIMRKGGKDVIVKKNQPAAISAEISQIFQNLGIRTEE